MDFLLEEWQGAYATAITKYANNKKIADNLRDAFPYPYTLADAAEYIASMSADNKKHLCRAIIVNGEAVGSIGVFKKDDVYIKSAEIGYWLAEPFWGKGIMSMAVAKICGPAFDYLDIVRISAEVFATNKASMKVLEKAGFNLEGILKNSVYKNGIIYDSHLYALVK